MQDVNIGKIKQSPVRWSFILLSEILITVSHLCISLGATKLDTPLFKLWIIFSFFAGLAAHQVTGRKISQDFFQHDKVSHRLRLINLVRKGRYQQELSKSIQNSELGFCAAETEMMHCAFKCFSDRHRTVNCFTSPVEEKDRRCEANRQVFEKCQTWSDVLLTRFLFLISFYFLIAFISRLERLFRGQELVLHDFYTTKNIDRV